MQAFQQESSLDLISHNNLLIVLCDLNFHCLKSLHKYKQNNIRFTLLFSKEKTKPVVWYFLILWLLISAKGCLNRKFFLVEFFLPLVLITKFPCYTEIQLCCWPAVHLEERNRENTGKLLASNNKYFEGL